MPTDLLYAVHLDGGLLTSDIGGSDPTDPVVVTARQLLGGAEDARLRTPDLAVRMATALKRAHNDALVTIVLWMDDDSPY